MEEKKKKNVLLRVKKEIFVGKMMGTTNHSCQDDKKCDPIFLAKHMESKWRWKILHHFYLYVELEHISIVYQKCVCIKFIRKDITNNSRSNEFLIENMSDIPFAVSYSCAEDGLLNSRRKVSFGNHKWLFCFDQIVQRALECIQFYFIFVFSFFTWNRNMPFRYDALAIVLHIKHVSSSQFAFALCTRFS